MSETEDKSTIVRRPIAGKVLSSKMDKTVSVLIEKILNKRKTFTRNVSHQWRIEKIKNLLNFQPRIPPLH